MEKGFKRKFLGELFPEKRNRNIEKAHLRAYLKGDKKFRYGLTIDGKPQMFTVMQELEKKSKIITQK